MLYRHTQTHTDRVILLDFWEYFWKKKTKKLNFPPTPQKMEDPKEMFAQMMKFQMELQQKKRRKNLKKKNEEKLLQLQKKNKERIFKK